MKREEAYLMSDALFPLTPNVLARVEACEVAFWAEKLAVLQALSGNPYGTAVRHFGHATALLAQHTSNNTLFNRICALQQQDLSHVDSVLHWYQQNAILPRFDLVPTFTSPELFTALTRHGFAHTGFYSALYGSPTFADTLPETLTIREVELYEAEQFAEVYRAGFGMPQTEATNYLYDGVRLLVGHPAMRCLFALVDRIPAAMAILYLYEETGYLATATTLPAFRRRGCQTALLRARIALAQQAGCDLVVGHTNVLSTSQRNMEQVGLRLAYTKALWTKAREVK